MSNKVFSPEKVRELVSLGVTQTVLCFNLSSEKAIDRVAETIDKWLGDNEPEPVVVGLSDNQVSLLAEELYKETSGVVIFELEKHIASFIKTQTFTQPSEAFKAAMVEVDIRNQEIEKLKAEIVALEEENTKLKAQQFEVDWSDAPDDCREAWQLNRFFYGDDNRYIDVLAGKQKSQKPPAPKIEFDVPYIYKNAKYRVQSVGKMRVGDDWIDSVMHVNDDHSASYTREISDFLAKFERVL